MRKNNREMMDENPNELKYGTQVALMSIGTILGIVVTIGAAVLIYFKDLLF